MLNSIKRFAAGLLIAVMLVGTVGTFTATEAEAAMAKPGNCRFVRWNNKKFTSCRIAWNSVSNADGYEIKWTYTDGSHYKHTYQYYYYNVLDINGLAYNHVYQAQVRALKLSDDGSKVSGYSPWSNLVFITPWPRTVSGSLSGSSNVKVKWNIIYGCNGYNVFMATNPYGTWRWNQSTSTKATSTSATIKKYKGHSLKKYTNYYIRIVTRRKRNGVFCTVPEPANGYYSGTFYLYTTYTYK